MEIWDVVALVLGSNFFIAITTYLATKIQVSHSDKRLEKELERTREVESRQRRWEVRSEPLLKLRSELSIMATKQDRVVSAAHKLHTRFGMTKEEAEQVLSSAVDNINAYLESGNFNQTLFIQSNREIVDKAEEIVKDYRESYISAIYYKDLKATEL